ncbi:MAG: ROK family protein [Planctomycetes bacterium]|nr:ROK family protein [Planctomycetota bacterium]
MARYCIGIDLGGTFIKFGLLDRDFQPSPTFQLPTPLDWGVDGLIQQMVAGAHRLIDANNLKADEVVGIGIGTPGPLSITEGVIKSLPNIPGMENVPLRDLIAENMGIQTAIENDANAAAFGEYICGAGRNEGDMVMLTLGTGVGSGIIQDGRILHGANEIGAEIGHMIIHPGGEECNCGQKGCLEAYCSATYISERCKRLMAQGRPSSLGKVLEAKGKLSSRDVNNARKAGDALAAEVWEQAAYYLAIGCVNICRILDPDRIIIGGGLASAGNDLLEPIVRHFRTLHWKLTEPQTEIMIGYLAGDAGVIGAAGVAWTAFGQTEQESPAEEQAEEDQQAQQGNQDQQEAWWEKK